jgi:hypothetical protein
LLVRLEADASLSACYGSNLVMQLNVNTLPTLTNFLPSAQRDFSGRPPLPCRLTSSLSHLILLLLSTLHAASDPGSAVAAQAMVFSVPVPDGTYYLGLFGNSPSSACPYDITARMECTHSPPRSVVASRASVTVVHAQCGARADLDYLEWGEVGEGSLRPANWHYYSINVETAPLKFQVNLTVLDLTQCPSPVRDILARVRADACTIVADQAIHPSAAAHSVPATQRVPEPDPRRLHA